MTLLDSAIEMTSLRFVSAEQFAPIKPPTLQSHCCQAAEVAFHDTPGWAGCVVPSGSAADPSRENTALVTTPE